MADDGSTYRECPHCKGNIVGEVEHIPRYDSLHMPMGPVSERNYRLVASFWCSKCGTIFKFPPGEPGAEEDLLANERKRIDEIRRKW